MLTAEKGMRVYRPTPVTGFSNLWYSDYLDDSTDNRLGWGSGGTITEDIYSSPNNRFA